jgi:hypothetical protein
MGWAGWGAEGGFGGDEVSIPFPLIRWPKIFSSYPRLKSLSHSFGLLCTTGMLPYPLPSAMGQSGACRGERKENS